MDELAAPRAEVQVAAMERAAARATAAVGTSSALNGATLAAAGCIYGGMVSLVGLSGPVRPQPLLAGVVALLIPVLLAVTWWARTRRHGTRAGWRQAAGAAQILTVLLWAVAMIAADSHAMSVPRPVWVVWAFATAAPMVAVGAHEVLARPSPDHESAAGAPVRIPTAALSAVSVQQFASHRDVGAVRLLATGFAFGVFTVFVGAFRVQMRPVMLFVLLTTAVGLAAAVLPRRPPRAFLLARLLTLALYVAAGAMSSASALAPALLPWAGIGVLVGAPAVVVGIRALPVRPRPGR